MFRAPLCPSSGAQEYYTVLLPVVFGAVVFKLLVWCGAEGYVSGLQDVICNTRPATRKPQHEIPQAATLYNTLELLMMGIVVSETC